MAGQIIYCCETILLKLMTECTKVNLQGRKRDVSVVGNQSWGYLSSIHMHKYTIHDSWLGHMILGKILHGI